MFLVNKYTKIYNNIMSRARSRESPAIYEKHHILPKSLGGTNSVDNIVKLSPREHFISHALLTKMLFDKKHKRAMAYAFSKMCISHNKTGYSRIGNGKLYEKIKKTIKPLYSGENNPFFNDSRFVGKNNPFYGKKHSEETKRKISMSSKLFKGEKNPFYGKKHSEETRKIISEKRSKCVKLIYLDGSSVTLGQVSEIGPFLGYSRSLGHKLCRKEEKEHVLHKYNIKEIVRI